MTCEVTFEISCLHFVPIKLVSFFGAVVSGWPYSHDGKSLHLYCEKADFQKPVAHTERPITPLFSLLEIRL